MPNRDRTRLNSDLTWRIREMQDISGAKSSVKPMLITLWLLAVLALAYAIYTQDGFFARTIPTIARIELPKGDVEFRSENKLRWNNAAAGSQLFDGDRVSTGRASSVQIAFKDGRSLILGEDSQVVISTVAHSEGEMTFLVNLVKGSVIADSKKKCTKCRDIVLRSGVESFKVGKDVKLGFFRDLAANRVEKFSVTGPVPVKNQVVAPVDEPVPEPVEPKKDAVVVKIPKISASGYEFNVRPPAEGLSIWTHKSVASLFGAQLSLPVISPERKPPFKTFIPIIEMANLDGTKVEILAGISATDTVIAMPIVKMRKVATQRWSGVHQYTVTLRGGIRVLGGRKPIDSFQSSKITLTINSIGEPLGSPLSLGFDRLSFQIPQGNWIAPKFSVPVNTSSIQVTVFGVGDFQKMIPFAVGATRYGAIASSQTTTSVANIVRDGYIVAQVVRYSSIDDVKLVMKVVNGSFAFIGPKSLFQYSAGTSQDNLVKLIDELLDKGRVMFFLKDRKLYPVSRSFIKNSKEVAGFLGQQANIFFTEKVEIVNR